VFGPISNGVLAEIKIASGLNKKIRYFKIDKPHKIVPVLVGDVELEDEIKDYRYELPTG
jgi:hypothetical protein